MIGRTTETFGGENSLTNAIVMATNQHAKAENETLDFVLYDIVDTDALAMLMDGQSDRESTIEVSFDVDEYEVTVSDGGTITVRSNSRSSSEVE